MVSLQTACCNALVVLRVGLRAGDATGVQEGGEGGKRRGGLEEKNDGLGEERRGA